MKINYIIILILVIFLSNVYSQWVEINGNFEGKPYRIDAIDSSKVFLITLSTFSNASHYMSLYYSENGGDQWEKINTPFRRIKDISIISENVIWIASDSMRIFNSYNRGNSWEVQNEGMFALGELYYIEMFDTNNGIAAGDGYPPERIPPFLKTTDGGKNWLNANLSNFAGAISVKNMDSFDFISVNTGYYMPHIENHTFEEQLFKTNDSGTSWTATNFIENFKYGHWIKFVNESVGYINYQGVPFNTIHRTIDAGNSWEVVYESDYNADQGGMIRTCNNSPEFVLAVLLDKIVVSNDTGKTWMDISIEADSNISIDDISVPGINNGWFVNYDGRIFKSNNLNLITRVNKSEKMLLPSEFLLEQNYPNPFNPATK